MERINAFNSALKQLCADEKCWYLDIYSMLVDEYGYLSSDYAFAGDGKHFEKSGYVSLGKLHEDPLCGRGPSHRIRNEVNL